MKIISRIELESMEDRTIEQCQEFLSHMEEIGWLDGWNIKLLTIEEKNA